MTNSEQRVRKVAVAVAVEYYADGRIEPVEYAAADATEFARVVGPLGFDAADRQVLIGEQATKGAIESALRTATAGLAADDILYVYWAGRGFTQKQRSFLACHETQLDDLVGTGVSLEWLLGQLEGAACRTMALFIDACGAGAAKMRGVSAGLAGVELEEFFGAAERRVCFAACRPGEASRRHGSLKHGVWASHLLRALNGDAAEALEDGALMTSSSLQRFLEQEVGRSIRTLFTGTATQTPWSCRAAGGDFLVADLGPVLAGRTTAAAPARVPLASVRLLSDERRSVRSFSGFVKGNFVPDRVNEAAEAFVSRIAEKDVDTEIEQVHRDLKGAFKFKRRDLSDSVDGGSGSIVTPYFDYEVMVSVNRDAPAEAIIRRQVMHIRRPDKVLSDEFDKVFEGKLDRLEFGTGDAIDVAQIVDRIEDLESDDITVTYDRDLTHCEIRVAGSNVKIEVTPAGFCIVQHGCQSPKALIQSFFDMQGLLFDRDATKPLPVPPRGA